LGQSIVSAVRPAIFDRQVVTLDIASLAQALEERAHTVTVTRTAAYKPHHRHRRLLRARRERPSGRAAEQRDELAALHHSITSSARSRSPWGMFSPRALAVVRLMMRSNLVGCWTGMSPGFVPRRILST